MLWLRRCHFNKDWRGSLYKSLAARSIVPMATQTNVMLKGVFPAQGNGVRCVLADPSTKNCCPHPWICAHLMMSAMCPDSNYKDSQASPSFGILTCTVAHMQAQAGWRLDQPYLQRPTSMLEIARAAADSQKLDFRPGPPTINEAVAVESWNSSKLEWLLFFHHKRNEPNRWAWWRRHHLVSSDQRLMAKCWAWRSILFWPTSSSWRSASACSGSNRCRRRMAIRLQIGGPGGHWPIPGTFLIINPHSSTYFPYNPTCAKDWILSQLSSLSVTAYPLIFYPTPVLLLLLAINCLFGHLPSSSCLITHSLFLYVSTFPSTYPLLMIIGI
jgi:hypothetical protein